tara:strand:- start:25 stop:390 length:366 start_codon:yes stop_codon:yes gene_type:complete
MAQTIGSGGGAAVGAEAELATKTPPGTKVGTKPVKKEVVETAEQTTPIVVPKTTEERVTTLEARLDDSVNVINNLIAFCNTMERWRTLPFKTDEQIKAEQAKAEETADTETPKEVDETTSE